ncbi:hypothetical protein ACOALA_16965 [Alicyclobacillus acidoterrestris]|uniref:hypothetical protein n=1 Tax=Alicyclobacillus acidoterrestris TaxID=1450 RepID=UPI003F52CD45
MKNRILQNAHVSNTTLSGLTGTVFAETTPTPQISESPNVIIGQAGYVFQDVTTEENNKFVEQAHSPVYYNGSSSTSPYNFTETSTFSVSASASGSLSAGWGPINAAVGFNADTSLSESWQYQVTVNVPAKHYGWFDYGYYRDEWYGDYAYQNQYGEITSDDWITVYSPRSQEYQSHTAASAPSNP